jgi:hypothetical protein
MGSIKKNKSNIILIKKLTPVVTRLPIYWIFSGFCLTIKIIIIVEIRLLKNVIPPRCHRDPIFDEKPTVSQHPDVKYQIIARRIIILFL